MEQLTDESTALEKLKQGDWSGLEILVRLHQAKALRVAFLITQDVAMAEDVVAETFLHLATHLAHFDQNRPFEPYLLRSVANAALKAIQAQKRHLSFDGNPALVEEIFERGQSVESQVEALELSRRLNEALQQLAPRQRLAIVQRYYLEMSEAEMSHRFGVAPGTIKYLLNAARSRLRSLLGSEGGQR
ncbi:MAG: RNA polymerase sigma-54 factor RpoN [Anaerolineae bacterium]|jgi:RNA polymerase sigma-70 factor (ECF subfamily)|nr:MAG: RNA polymerase sigma-54 factor RpoN [Anaerolineae bacterium]